MEPTALRPKPMPGQRPGAEADDANGDGACAGAEPAGGRRPHAARRRGRRLTTLLLGLSLGTVLLLSGIGLGTVGATVIGMSRLAEWQRQTGQTGQTGQGGQSGQGVYAGPSASVRVGAVPSSPQATPSPSSAPAAATLGVEAVDAGRPGALVVGVHVPGPGYTAGLVRGDVLLALDETRIDTAADLARAVADTRPGDRVTLTVRHRSGGFQQLTALPGVVT
jgi:membrane-associated protease RseP (regulator of RpoE activity)